MEIDKCLTIVRIPNKKPTMFISFFRIRLPGKKYSKSFQKYVYGQTENEKYTALHYVGDPSVFQPLSHSNSESENAVFIRTCPSIIEKIKSRADGATASATANLIERELIYKAESGSVVGVKTSKILNQEKSHLYKTRRENRFSNDEFYNLFEISKEYRKF